MERQTGLDLWLYLRKSRKDIEEERKAFDETYDTLEKHRKHLLKIAKAEHHNIIDILPEIVSGEFISERPKMQKLLREIESGHGDGVLVMDLDRLGRGDMVDQGTIYRVFKYSEALIVTPTEIINFDEPAAETLFSVRSLVAREELKMTTGRLQRGRRDSAASGRSITNRVPYGYKRDEHMKLVPDPETSWVIELIFEMIADGYGRREVARALQHKYKLKTPTGGDDWDTGTIPYIIKNPVYLGSIVWRKYSYTKVRGSYRKKKLPSDQWYTKDNAHPGIISKDLFDRANDAFSGRYRTPTTNDRSLKNPFAGILKCAVCGKGMRHQQGYGGRRDRCICLNMNCNGQRSTAFEEVADAILDGMKRYIDMYQTYAEPEQKSSAIPAKEKALEQHKKALDEFKKQKESLHDFLERKVYDIDTFLDREKILTGRIKETQKAIKEIKKEIESEQKDTGQVIPKMKSVLSAYLATDDVEQKNHLMKSIFEKITYRRKKEWSEKGHFEIELYPRV